MEQVNNSVPAINPETHGSGLSFAGVIQVFLNPSEFFTKLKNNPKIFIPYLILAVLTAVFFLLVKDYIIAMQLNNPEAVAKLEESGVTVETVRPMMEISTIVGGLFAMLLTPLIEAALAWFWGNFVFAGSAKFKQVLSVVLYGEILFAVGMLLHVPLIIAKKSMLVSYSLAVLVADKGPTSIWYIVLSKISVFHIWEVIAVGIGLSIIYATSRNKGIVMSVLSIGLLTVLGILMSIIGVMLS